MRPEDAGTPRESRWEKSKHAFERILEDSQRATETLMRTLEELGQRTRARVEKARIQRLLFRRSAELGSRLYELSRTGGGTDGMPNPFGDGTVKSLLLEISTLDEALKNAEAQIAKDTDEVPEA
jgi:hypothetical protein